MDQDKVDADVIELAVKGLRHLRDSTGSSDNVKDALTRAANSIELSVGDWE